MSATTPSRLVITDVNDSRDTETQGNNANDHTNYYYCVHLFEGGLPVGKLKFGDGE